MTLAEKLLLGRSEECSADAAEINRHTVRIAGATD
jgi:hypothetical protein